MTRTEQRKARTVKFLRDALEIRRREMTGHTNEMDNTMLQGMMETLDESAHSWRTMRNLVRATEDSQHPLNGVIGSAWEVFRKDLALENRVVDALSAVVAGRNGVPASRVFNLEEHKRQTNVLAGIALRATGCDDIQRLLEKELQKNDQTEAIADAIRLCLSSIDE